MWSLHKPKDDNYYPYILSMYGSVPVEESDMCRPCICVLQLARRIERARIPASRKEEHEYKREKLLRIEGRPYSFSLLVGLMVSLE